MLVNELASYLAKREGKKVQARIGEIREVLGLLSDHLAVEGKPVIGEGSARPCIGLESDTIVNLYQNGLRRARRKSGKTKAAKKR